MTDGRAAWLDLNGRQQGTLRVIFGLDQEAEASSQSEGDRGEESPPPGGFSRPIDFAHSPGDRALYGWTEMQHRLDRAGWDNQGNGSTMAALHSRGLISRSSRVTVFGQMLMITLTPAGRAAAQAGAAMPGPSRAPLSRRSWEVLAMLWAAGDGGLQWQHSSTVEHVLIGRHVPPLAERADGAYLITSQGRKFYRENYAAHVAAYPAVRAARPGRAGPDPWPAHADEILARHWQEYRALCQAWQEADTARRAAEAEVSSRPPARFPFLPDAVSDLAAERHQLWTSTARQRADLAVAHTAGIRLRAEHAARAYALAATAAFAAAVLDSDPLATPKLPAGPGSGTGVERSIPPPAKTGIDVIDIEAADLHRAATGFPAPRRGSRPGPRRRRRNRDRSLTELPGRVDAALADFLRFHVSGGDLQGRLHPGARQAGSGPGLAAQPGS